MVPRTSPSKELIKHMVNTVITLTVLLASAPVAITIWAWFTWDEHKRYAKEFNK